VTLFPSAVVHGIMSAIGVIVLSKRPLTLLAVVPEGKKPLQLLWEISHRSHASGDPLKRNGNQWRGL